MQISSVLATALPSETNGSRELPTAPKAHNVAEDFESLLLTQLLKQLRSTGGEENALFPGDTTDTLGSLFDVHMSRHLAAHGGFGLAKSLADQLPTTGDSHG